MSATVWQAAEVAYQPSQRLLAAQQVVAEREAALKEAMADLYQAVAEEVAMPNKPADVARYMDWHAGYVRKLARERGVPGYVDRKPPSPHPQTEPGHDQRPPV